MKKLFIVANWKMNPQTLVEAKVLFDSMARGIKYSEKLEIVICPPHLYIANFKSQNTNLKIGAQNCFYESNGAFTGEISAVMLKNMGCEYVILGHSERRKYQKEADGIINKKIKTALTSGLRPILCVDKISQAKDCLKDVPQGEMQNILVAYEPLGYIGTGNACDPKKAEETRVLIKKECGKETPILYGGSVSLQNAKDYIKKVNFSGLLVGGASLKPDEFVGIINTLISQ